MKFSFLYPDYLLLLFIIPLMILLHFISLKSRGKQVMKFANFEAIARIKNIDLYSKNIMILALSIATVFCLIMSISGVTLHIITNSSSYSFVIAIDSSGSMEANDISPTRLDAAKSLAVDFVKSNKPDTKIGVLSFSGNSIIEQEASNDKWLANSAIQKIEISGVGGTDISEAITTSTNMMKNEKGGKAVILFSDGQINVGDLDYAIDYAKDNKVVVNTIAIGKKTGGNTTYGISKLDEDTLKAISYNTNGKFISLENTGDFSEKFEEIMQLKEREVSISLSKYLLILSLLLFVIVYVLINTRYKAII